MRKQYVAKKSLAKGAAQTRRLNVQRSISPSVLNATFHLTAENAAKGSLQTRHAAIRFGRGSLIIEQGEAFYLVESAKFAGRYYVLVERDGRWFSSSDDARVTVMLAKQVTSLQVAA